MTKSEFAAEVQRLARAMADDAAAAWPCQIRLHERAHASGVLRYAVSVHKGNEADQRMLILWREANEVIGALPIPETVWAEIDAGAKELGWN